MPSYGLIVGGVGPAVRFVAMAWREAWAALIAAAATIGAVLTAGSLGAPPASRAAWLGLALLAATVTRGALYRLALARPGMGPGGLQWGRTEGRLLAVWLLGAVFLFILGLLFFTALIASAYAVASAGAGFVAAEPATWAKAVDGRGRLVLGALGAAGTAALVWAALRLCLAAAASVARGRVQVLSAWPLTRRRAWRLGLALALVGAPPAALLATLFFVGKAVASAPPIAAGAVGFAQGLVIAGLWLPMNVGLMAYLYGRLALAQPPNPLPP